MRLFTAVGFIASIAPTLAAATGLDLTRRAAIISCIKQEKTEFETLKIVGKFFKLSENKTTGTLGSTEEKGFSFDVEEGYLFVNGTGQWVDNKVTGYKGSFGNVSISEDRKKVTSSIKCTGFNVLDTQAGGTECEGILSATQQLQTDPNSMRKFILKCIRLSSPKSSH